MKELRGAMPGAACPHCGQQMPDPEDPIAMAGAVFPDLPVAELVRRCWVPYWTGDDEHLNGAELVAAVGRFMDEARATMAGMRGRLCLDVGQPQSGRSAE